MLVTLMASKPAVYTRRDLLVSTTASNSALSVKPLTGRRPDIYSINDKTVFLHNLLSIAHLLSSCPPIQILDL